MKLGAFPLRRCPRRSGHRPSTLLCSSLPISPRNMIPYRWRTTARQHSVLLVSQRIARRRRSGHETVQLYSTFGLLESTADVLDHALCLALLTHGSDGSFLIMAVGNRWCNVALSTCIVTVLLAVAVPGLPPRSRSTIQVLAPGLGLLAVAFDSVSAPQRPRASTA